MRKKAQEGLGEIHPLLMGAPWGGWEGVHTASPRRRRRAYRVRPWAGGGIQATSKQRTSNKAILDDMRYYRLR